MVMLFNPHAGHGKGAVFLVITMYYQRVSYGSGSTSFILPQWSF